MDLEPSQMFKVLIRVVQDRKTLMLKFYQQEGKL